MIKRIILIILLLACPAHALDTGWGTIETDDLITVTMLNNLHLAVDSKLNNDIMILAGSDGKAILDSGGDYIKWPGGTGSGDVNLVDIDTQTEMEDIWGVLIENDDHASEHGKDGVDPVDRYFEGETISALTPGDATPTVITKSIYDCTGGTTITITDFDMAGVSVGDYFGVLMNDPDVTIDFSDNSNIEGNLNQDYTGLATQINFLIFTWMGTYWQEENLVVGMSDPASLSIGAFVYDFTPDTDDTWQGSKTTVTAGETISQWDIIYIKYDTDGPRAFMYNANSTDYDNDTYRPRGIALEAGTAGNSLEIGIGQGVVRNDGYTFTDTTDEGKPVFAGETDGAITLTRPSDSGDHIIHLGNLIDEDEVEFNFGSFADVVVP